MSELEAGLAFVPALDPQQPVQAGVLGLEVVDEPVAHRAAERGLVVDEGAVLEIIHNIAKVVYKGAQDEEDLSIFAFRKTLSRCVLLFVVVGDFFNWFFGVPRDPFLT